MELLDVISPYYLENSLNRAISWCKKELPNQLHKYDTTIDHGLLDKVSAFDYSIFDYLLVELHLCSFDFSMDNDRVKKKQKGLIYINIPVIEHILKRQAFHEDMTNKIGLGNIDTEFDVESIFIHEIVEFIVDETLELNVHFLSNLYSSHMVAGDIENINRVMRGLKRWPH